MARRPSALDACAWQLFIDLPLTTDTLRGLLERLKEIIDGWEAEASAAEIRQRQDERFYRSKLISVRVGRNGMAHLKLGDREATIDVSDLIYLDNRN
jgi:hypothetical protein